MNGLIFLLMTSVPHEGRELREQVPSVELNHMLHECGDESFCQLIFDEPESILAWKMRADVLWSYHPTRLYWWDGDKLRIVEPGSWQESWTYWDRESEMRAWLPPEWRKGLRK